MSGVLLYGITSVEDDSELALGLGLDDRPLREVEHEALVAILAEHPNPGPEPGIESLRAYGRVIERLARDRTLLPARFGTVLPDDISALALLRDRHATLLTALDRIRGAVELGVRATWRDDVQAAAPSPDSGSEYIAAKLALRARARGVADALDPLADIARASRQTVAGRAELSIACAYLVDRERVAEFISRVAQLDTGLDEVELACTGPWPAYSFTEAA